MGVFVGKLYGVSDQVPQNSLDHILVAIKGAIAINVHIEAYSFFQCKLGEVLRYVVPKVSE